jgi:hypothetical protein
MAGPSKCLCIDKLEESVILQELYCEADSEGELGGSQSSSEHSQKSDNDDELEWRENFPTGKAFTHQFLGNKVD